MPPMLEMLCTPRLASAPSAEAAPAGQHLSATAQRAARKHHWSSTHKLGKSCPQELHFKQRWWHHPRYGKHASSRQHHERHRYKLPHAHCSDWPRERGPSGTFTPCKHIWICCSESIRLQRHVHSCGQPRAASWTTKAGHAHWLWRPRWRRSPHCANTGGVGS